FPVASEMQLSIAKIKTAGAKRVSSEVIAHINIQPMINRAAIAVAQTAANEGMVPRSDDVDVGIYRHCRYCDAGYVHPGIGKPGALISDFAEIAINGNAVDGPRLPIDCSRNTGG